MSILLIRSDRPYAHIFNKKENPISVDECDANL